MCRLFAVTSSQPQSPVMAINALNVMKEGHDGSGVGLFLTDLGGEFEKFKNEPILSGIFSNEGIKALDRFMIDLDFMVKYKLSFRPTRPTPAGTPKRDNYVIRVYEYPADWEDMPQDELQHRLMMIQLQLRAMGEKDQSMLIFSFWPDTIMILITDLSRPVPPATSTHASQPHPFAILTFRRVARSTSSRPRRKPSCDLGNRPRTLIMYIGLSRPPYSASFILINAGVTSGDSSLLSVIAV